MYGDLVKPDTLQKALDGIECVIACANSLMGRGRYDSREVDEKGHKQLVDLAKEKNVKRFIYTSVIGASPDHPVDFFRTKYLVEQHLIKSNLPYTIIRPSAFMEVHIHKLMGESIIEKGKVKIFGKGKNPSNYVSAIDVALLISSLVKNGEGINEIIEIGGPSNLTKIEIVHLYEEQLGKKIKTSSLSPSTLKFMSRLITPFHKGLGRIMHMSATMDAVDASLENYQSTEKFEVGRITVEEFIKRKVKDK